ncbi:MAG: hypothetical protein HC782_04155 [Gammaproteobacteria bacterium]|nr:hypothetical protein [Gammaproteobacteria bacterium]
MKSTYSIAFSVIAITLVLQAAEASANNPRLEEATPYGRVPPSNSPVRSEGIPREQNYIGTKVTPAPKPRFDSETADAEKFGSAYQRAKSPRIAIYFNRSLSDQVSEWVSTRRTLDQLQYESNVKNSQTMDGKKIASGTSAIKGEVTRTNEQQVFAGNAGERDDPAERWVWEFENAIINRFLDQNVNVVDRALMFRLMANKSPSVSNINNESSALSSYADVLIEVLVTRSNNSHIGYDFRATAKSIKQQTIIASTFFDGATNTNAVTERYTTDQSGYRKVIEQAPLKIDDVAAQLSLKLMSALTKRWAKN